MSLAGGYVGHLVTITSAAEQNFIVGQGLGLGTATEFGYLLGAFRNSTSDPFSWVTGEAFVYSNFLPGEPNGDSPPQTIHFFGLGSTAGGWNDVSQSDLRFPGYIVEYERVAGNNVPEPASLALFGLALAGLASARRRKA